MKLLQNRGWTSWIIFFKITHNGVRKKMQTLLVENKTRYPLRNSQFT